jgi:hypothetical protein
MKISRLKSEETICFQPQELPTIQDLCQSFDFEEFNIIENISLRFIKSIKICTWNYHKYQIQDKGRKNGILGSDFRTFL